MLMLVAFFCGGCCAPTQTERIENTVIVHDTVKVFVPSDTQFDTVYVSNGQGESERYIVKIDTVKVLIKGKGRIIYVPRIDTVLQTIYKTTVEKGFFDGISLKQIVIGAFILIVLGLVFSILRVMGVFNK